MGNYVLVFISIFEKVNNVKVPYKYKNRGEGDNGFVVPDNSLTMSVLNWKPKINIEDIWRNGSDWKLKNPY